MDKEITEGGIHRRWPESFEIDIGPCKIGPKLGIFHCGLNDALQGPISFEPKLGLNVLLMNFE